MPKLASSTPPSPNKKGSNLRDYTNPSITHGNSDDHLCPSSSSSSADTVILAELSEPEDPPPCSGTRPLGRAQPVVVDFSRRRRRRSRRSWWYTASENGPNILGLWWQSGFLVVTLVYRIWACFQIIYYDCSCSTPLYTVNTIQTWQKWQKSFSAHSHLTNSSD